MTSWFTGNLLKACFNRPHTLGMQLLKISRLCYSAMLQTMAVRLMLLLLPVLIVISLPFHAYKVTYSCISSVYSRIMFALRNHLLLCPHISHIPMCFALVVYQTKPLVFFLQTTQCHHLTKTCISIGIYKRVKKFTILLLPGTAADLTIQFTVLLLHNISPI